MELSRNTGMIHQHPVHRTSEGDIRDQVCKLKHDNIFNFPISSSELHVAFLGSPQGTLTTML